tara:strand:- start:167 stop:508 length:342 start_codon:yes stop_codon:yes gene_type:complete
MGFICYEKLDMYAVIESGGKQYKVTVGEKVKVEKLNDEVGSEIVIDKVLALGNGESIQIGDPNLKGVSVLALIIKQSKSEKVRIFKMRRRKHSQKTLGHRQRFTELEIISING